MNTRGFCAGMCVTAAIGSASAQQIETGDLIFFAQDPKSGEYGAYLLSDLENVFGVEPTPFRLPGDMFIPGGDQFVPTNVGFGANLWMERQGQGVEGILPIVDQNLNFFPFVISGEEAATQITDPINLGSIGDALFPGDMFIPGGDQFDLVFLPGDMFIPGGDQFLPSRPMVVLTDAGTNLVTIVELTELGEPLGSPEVWAEFEVADVSLLLGGIVAPDMIATDVVDSTFYQMAFYEDGVEGGPPTLHLVDAGTGGVTSIQMPQEMAGIKVFTAGQNGIHGLRENTLEESVEIVSMYYPQTDVFVATLAPNGSFDGTDFGVSQLFDSRFGMRYPPPQRPAGGDRGFPADVLVFAVPAEQSKEGAIVAVDTGSGEVELVVAGGESFRDPRDIAYVVTDPVIDPPDPCVPDTNGDGLLTPADFNAWILAFNTNAPACDQNGDNACTPADFNAWILNFNAGC